MAIIIKTTAPNTLHSKIKKKANSDDSFETWTIDKDGDFTHNPPQWNKKAWLRPFVDDGQLKFRIIPPKGATISKATYAVYHGRFIEMLLAHFDGDFDEAYATAMPASGDRVISQ